MTLTIMPCFSVPQLIATFRDRRVTRILRQTRGTGYSYTPLTADGKEIGIGLSRLTFEHLQLFNVVDPIGDPAIDGTYYDVTLP